MSKLNHRDGLPGLCARLAGAALALLLIITGPARAQYPATTTPDGRQRTSSLVENPPAGVTFYQANAMGPSSLRANTTAIINSVKARDSTIVLETKGASRLGVWLYVLPDSGVHSDSLRLAVFGVTPKIHLTPGGADSGSSAIPIYANQDTLYGRRGGLRGVAQDYGYLGAGMIGENVNVAGVILPGEMVVAVPSYAVFNLGQPRARYFEVAASDFGAGVLPPYVSLVFRAMGTASQWPTATIVRVPTRRWLVRVDVWGLR